MCGSTNLHRGLCPLAKIEKQTDNRSRNFKGGGGGVGSQRGVQPLTLGNLYWKLTKSSKAVISDGHVFLRQPVKTPKSLPHVYASGHVDLYIYIYIYVTVVVARLCAC